PVVLGLSAVEAATRAAPCDSAAPCHSGRHVPNVAGSSTTGKRPHGDGKNSLAFSQWWTTPPTRTGSSRAPGMASTPSLNASSREVLMPGGASPSQPREEIVLEAGAARAPAHELKALAPEDLIEEGRRHPGEEDLGPHLAGMRHQRLALAFDLRRDVDLRRDQLIRRPDLELASLAILEVHLDARVPHQAAEGAER